jgi:hypothetical protein
VGAAWLVVLRFLMLLLLLLLTSQPRPAAAQAAGRYAGRPLIVEVRVVRAADVAEAEGGEARPGGQALSTRRHTAELPPQQQVRVVEGQLGLFRYQRRLPVFWTEAAAQQGGGQVNGQMGGQGGGSARAVKQRLVWLEVGQSLAVKARWPGGRAPARVELALEAQALDAAAGSQGMPAAQSTGLRSVISLPMGRWSTFAALGEPEAGPAGKPGARTLSTRSQQPGQERLLWQLRISADGL